MRGLVFNARFPIEAMQEGVRGGGVVEDGRVTGTNADFSLMA